MASSPHFLLLLLHLILLFTSCFSATPYSDSTLKDHASVELDGNAQRTVELSVYYEALCPYCGNFILNQLVELFKTDIAQIVDLRLVPWGNASLKNKFEITCQHGPDECRLNTIEACVIKTWPDFRRHYGMIHCIERLVFTQKENKLQSCFGSINEWQTLHKCYNSGLGTQLDLKYADETTHLNPPLQFVPWVVVNGRALKDDYGNFLAYICKVYSGPKPDGCRSIQHKINSADKVQQKP
ncbi:unnamed protein product [Rhodiola kirilowii]